ncbi:MAG: reverse transcriptase domain-containing protein [Candidatus Saccharimonadales bacterium]
MATTTYHELLAAYLTCRRHKRNTNNALKFEADYEQNLLNLLIQFSRGSYHPSRSIAFIVDKPVKREIFAADFRDRVVHHLIINKLNPIFEKWFIYDSYACRPDKGALLGIRRLDRFIRQCSDNYAKDCYVLKLDVKGFFMHINKDRLWRGLQDFIDNHYDAPDKPLLLELCQKIIYNDPTKNCVIKGSKSDWAGLPPDKSLFHSPPDCGLPIGNLTSQVFANFYMSRLDHFIKHDLKIKYYARYVDDFVLVHQDKDYLRSLISVIRDFLASELGLTLHPNKIYLQHYSKGVRFLGVVIKPGRIYSAKRMKGNFYNAIASQNQLIRDHRPPSDEELAAFLSSMNSYLGLLRHYQTYKLRKKMVYKHLSAWWWNYVSLNADATKFYRRTKHLKKRPK